ncbi:hypothetical protein AMECASPLE_037388 [Ameca splendens]|uniref:Uncharacterized protein n=1 Tax=Ameca splendens TaxID=208324 RepID=A0ABV0ZGM3_9TELE
MDKPKSARTQDRSDRTRTFLLVRSLWATGGLYCSEWGQTQQTTGEKLSHDLMMKVKQELKPQQLQQRI